MGSAMNRYMSLRGDMDGKSSAVMGRILHCRALFGLVPRQDVGDALELLYPLYGEISRTVVRHFHTGDVPRIQQDHSQATVFPRRKPDDGLIDWNMSVRSVWNLIRAVAHPYPGAF